MQQYVYANTTGGKLRGAVQDEICIFKGIPYGATTAGAARFMAPRKRAPWIGVRDALRFGPACAQLDILPIRLNSEIGQLMQGGLDERTDTYSEDCLVLNLWTMGMRDNAKRPVMVWCHSGRFAEGSGAGAWCNGAALARGDAVVVSVNHRLNVLGYLHLGDLGGESFGEGNSGGSSTGKLNFAASGNAGMLDIVAALEWIRDNIAEFGGDPNNVTLFGNSGGGCKVSVLMAMPAAQGLFHKAIVQSGTLRHLAGSRLQRTRLAQALLEDLGLSAARLAELQHIPLANLHPAIAAMEGKFGDPFSMGIFTPTLDGHFLSEEPFDPHAPALSNNIPLLIGSTRDEMRVLLGEAAFAITVDQLLPTLQQLTGVDTRTATLWIELYREIDHRATPSDILFALASDFFIRSDAIAQAQRKSLQPAPVYMYQFTWHAPAFDGKYRAAHGLEVPFVFGNVDKAPGLCAAPAQYRTLEAKISAAWLAFARTGNPSHDALPAWPRYQIDSRQTMLLGDACEAVDDPAGELRQAICAAKFQ